MKKPLLILCMAAALIGCSKNDDEPSGGGNDNPGAGTETPGGNESGNKDNSFWNVICSESKAIINGSINVENTSQELKDWMGEYGKDFKTVNIEEGIIGAEQTTGSFYLYNPSFEEMDDIVSEYVGFTMYGDDDNPGGDIFTAMVYNYSSSKINYMIYYNYNDTENAYTDPWTAVYNFTYSNSENNPDGHIAKGIEEWYEDHKEYLTHEYKGSNFIEYEWTIPYREMNENIIEEEICPFLDMHEFLDSFNTFEVDLYKLEDPVSRWIHPGVNN